MREHYDCLSVCQQSLLLGMRKASGSQETGRSCSEYLGTTIRPSSNSTVTSTIASACLELTLWGGVLPATQQSDTKPPQQVFLLSLFIMLFDKVLQATWAADTAALWTLKHSDLLHNWFHSCWKSALLCAYFTGDFFHYADKIYIPSFVQPLTRTLKISKSKVICLMKWISTGRWGKEFGLLLSSYCKFCNVGYLDTVNYSHLLQFLEVKEFLSREQRCSLRCFINVS